MNRRPFLKNLGASAAVSALPSALSAQQEKRVSPGERIQCAAIGLGARGRGLVANAVANPHAHVVTACDVKQSTLESVARTLKQQQGADVKQTRDFREALADPAVDAVLIATPHHWHSPIALRALEAGKHVYVEKPASHVFREGRLLVELAREKKLVFQHGTQMRSSEVTLEAAKVLKSGVLGEIQMVRGWSVEPRRHPEPLPDEDPPAGLDYDTWLGPAPERPYNRNRFSRWRFYRDYGNGEMGDDGIHDIDLCCFGLGAKTHPVRIEAHGSEINLKGETEYPNHVVASFQYADGKELLYETRNWAPYKMHGYDSGNMFYGEEGYMLFTRRGMFQTYLGGGEKKGPGMMGSGGNVEHMANFLESVRTGGEMKINADAETAHLSCAIVHLGEISFRTGQVIHFDPEKEEILTKAGGERDDRLSAMLSKKYRAPWGI